MTWKVRLILPITLMLAGLIYAVDVAEAAICFDFDRDGSVCAPNLPQATFAAPELLADSFIQQTSYGRLADLTLVYPEPTTAVAPVRNVGDGYLFSTIEGMRRNEAGELWYMINYGEWVRAEDVTLAEISEFAGIEINRQPERPFGWMIVDYWYSRTPGGDLAQHEAKLPRYTFFQVYDAVEAEDGWLWYNIGLGRWVRQTYVSLIDIDPRPQGVGPNDYWVEVDLYEQSFAAYMGDRIVYAGLVSSGLNRWPTHEGLFQITSDQRFARTKMSGAEGRVDYYYIEDVPHTMYFDMEHEIALHGAFWHDRFGYKHSHGCVNMPPRDAEWVFNWSDNAANDLWVWVHTSDPTHYFDRYDPETSFAGP